MRFDPLYPIDGLTPADYNPRLLPPEAFTRLKESLRRFGVQKPVIVNANGTIVAGHQRIKALRAIGVREVPAILMDKEVGLTDEIRFNLMHNSIETERTPVDIPTLDEGWQWIQPQFIECGRNENAAVVKEICGLLSRFGTWGSIIADTEGNVIANSDYAYACRLLNMPVLAAVLQPETARELLTFLAGDYGVYSYGAVGIKTYNQMLAQPQRMATATVPTYEKLVKPSLKEGERLVDFGAGECKSVAELLSKGWDAFAYEPHLRKRGTGNIDVAGVVRQIAQLRATIARRGLFDVCVLDSVINSVTSIEWAHRVLTACNCLLKADGRFYTATRSMGTLKGNAKNSRWTSATKAIEFLDPDGFAGTYMDGVWVLQLFLTGDEFRELLSQYFAEVTIHVNKAETDYIRASCARPLPLSDAKITDALENEFNMEYPGGYRHGKQGPLVAKLLELVHERSSSAPWGDAVSA